MSSAAFTILPLTHGEDEKGEKRRRSHEVGSFCLLWMAGLGSGRKERLEAETGKCIGKQGKGCTENGGVSNGKFIDAEGFD